MTRRLRAVPEHRAPTMIDLPDTPEPDTLTDDWRNGWQACREVLADEWAAWYQRGMTARPIEHGVRLDLMLSGTAAFIVGFVIALALFA